MTTKSYRLTFHDGSQSEVSVPRYSKMVIDQSRECVAVEDGYDGTVVAAFKVRMVEFLGESEPSGDDK